MGIDGNGFTNCYFLLFRRLRFSFFGRPLKYLSQREDLNMVMNLTSGRKILICIVEPLKVFLHPPPPSKTKNLIRIVESRISKVTTLSI